MRMSKRKLSVLVIAVGLFIVVMYVEWLNKSTLGPGNASPVFGPFHFVTDVAPENIRDGIVACVILIPMIFLFFIWPHPITALVSLVGVLIWLFLGVIGKSIGC